MARHQTGGGPQENASAPSISVTKEKVSQDFSHLYFKILNEQPELLAQFYGEDSSVVACESHSQGPTFRVCAENKEDIKKHLEIFENITVELTTCAPQLSLGDSILLVVTGNLKKEGSSEDQERFFTQAFLLAKQNEGFYIRTDTLQIHSNRCSTNILTNRPGNVPLKKSPPKQGEVPIESEISSNLPDPSTRKPLETTPEAPLIKHQTPRKHPTRASVQPKHIELPAQPFQVQEKKKHPIGGFPDSQIQDAVLPVFGSISVEEIDSSLKPTGEAPVDLTFGEISTLVGNGAPAANDRRNKPGGPYVEHLKEPLGRRNMGPNQGEMPRKPPMANQKDQAVEPPSTYVKPIQKPPQMLPQRPPPLQYVEPNITVAPSGAAANRRKSYVDVLRNPVGQIENRVTPTANPLTSAPTSGAVSGVDVPTSTPTVQNELGASRETFASTQTPLFNQVGEQPERNPRNGPNRVSKQQRKNNGNSGVGSASETEHRSRLTSLFVCRLPPDITAKSIEQIFARFGELKTGVRVLTGPKSRYTFVDFVSEDSVRAALAAEIRIGSEMLVVERWQPKRDFRRNGFVGR